MSELAVVGGDIAIIGVGNMGGAIVAGLTEAGFAPQRIRVVDPNTATAVAQQYGVVPMPDAAQAALGASMIIIAVKPPMVRDTVTQCAATLTPGALVISVAAGVTIANIEGWASEAHNPSPGVIRAIPNTPARLRQGVTAMSLGGSVTEAQVQAAQAVFGAIGAVVLVDEPQMAAVTAVSGCGPAYLFLVAEAMTEAGVRLGLPRAAASRLVTHTFGGSSALLATGESPTELRAQVTSPGGTTAAAIFELENRGLRAAFSAGMQAAVDRSRELA